MKKTLKDIDVNGKKVIVRVDYNVPMENSEITDDIRIKRSLDTINYLLDNNAKVILMSHLGRPKGEYEEKFSLKPVAKRLEKLLNKEVKFADDKDGLLTKAKELAKNLKEKEVLLLENLRFNKAEKKNDREFAKELASLADIYVNDAFGTAHRAHASTAGITEFLPSAMGFLIEKEVKIMGDALKNPSRPFVAVLGGSKVSDKIGVIENLIKKVDVILIGGAMAYTFLKSQNVNVGKSKIEEDKLDLAFDLLNKAKENNVKLILPVDHIIAKEFPNETNIANIDIKNSQGVEIDKDYMGLDIGEKTIELYTKEILKAKTIILNGPMGVFEVSQFENGTREIERAIGRATKENKAVSIIGGGDSSASCKKFNLEDEMTHISTGGGASLEFLEGKVLPGIDAIEDI